VGVLFPHFDLPVLLERTQRHNAELRASHGVTAGKSPSDG
jgi:hypothetical protein